ncbi:DUF6250 domain-containing protein [Dyadobacter sp. CY312]|uniref:DUF6250 domain-containing protein n=1 Tax=Dyadobacter sp. CY312 TaxID=2907303 RepID=UPI001F46BCE7|nr:DUF6250 domain-containing protein [Dyadobacter sp. CY312]MCE7041849.1 DUF6250 domain-containing protein [Dyadobacter sp. CY312]
MVGKVGVKFLNFFSFRFFVFSVSIFLLAPDVCEAQSNRPSSHILYQDHFNQSLDTTLWKVEMVPGENASVDVQNGKLVIDSPGGVSVWFNKKLTGDLVIEYDWRVIVAGGTNDRLSDLNQFWMATDPKNENLFTRNGKFEAYDSLSLYYVGMGGNTNSTTRFRKYHGNGSKPLLQEHIDEAHLLKANHTYHIKIVVENGTTSYWVDGGQYFSYKDPEPLTEGFFGFRSTWARHEIDDFRVYRP